MPSTPTIPDGVKLMTLLGPPGARPGDVDAWPRASVSYLDEKVEPPMIYECLLVYPPPGTTHSPEPVNSLDAIASCARHLSVTMRPVIGARHLLEELAEDTNAYAQHVYDTRGEAWCPTAEATS